MATIRGAEQRDKGELCIVHRSSIKELCKTHYTDYELKVWYERLYPEYYTRYINEGEIYVAEENSEIIGFAQLNHRTGRIEALYIHPHYSRMRIGTLLLKKLIAVAMTYGIKLLHLSSTLNAIPFYKNNGFIQKEPLKYRFLEDVEISCVKMELQIDRALSA
jgi:putative acetyltransferase